jgi:short-subunit dehydrogenase
LDVLVNNAGISGQTAPVEEADPDQWEAVMTVDVIRTFHVTRLSIPHLKKSAAGSIIVMSSVGERFGYPNRSAYCTAKMGLIGFAKTHSRELAGSGVRGSWGASCLHSANTAVGTICDTVIRRVGSTCPEIDFPASDVRNRISAAMSLGSTETLQRLDTQCGGLFFER